MFERRTDNLGDDVAEALDDLDVACETMYFGVSCRVNLLSAFIKQMLRSLLHGW